MKYITTIQHPEFQNAQWTYLGSGAYHRVHVSFCGNWVLKSPLTRCGLLKITDASDFTAIFTKIQIVLNSSNAKLDTAFLRNKDQLYYFFITNESQIQWITFPDRIMPDHLFDIILEVQELRDEEYRLLSLLELNNIAPLFSQVDFSTFQEEIKHFCARNVRKWRLVNPGYPVYDLGDAWATSNCGVQQANDETTQKLVQDTFNNTGELILDASGSGNVLIDHGEAICIDLDLAITRESIHSEKILSETVPDRSFEEHLQYWYAHGKPKTVETIRTLLYLISSVEKKYIQKYVITNKLLHVLHYLRKQNRPLTESTLFLLAEITSFEFMPIPTESYYQRHLLDKIVNKTYTTTLMYYVGSHNLDKIKHLLFLNHSLLPRNGLGQNILDLALDAKELDIGKSILKVLLLQIGKLDPTEQQDLFRNTLGRTYNNVFRYTATHAPDTFQILSDTWSRSGRWATEITYLTSATQILSSVAFDQSLSYFTLFANDNGQQTDPFYKMVNCLQQRLREIRMDFLLSSQPMSQNEAQFITQCVEALREADRELPARPARSLLSNTFSFFGYPFDFHDYYDLFKKKIQAYNLLRENYVVVNHV